MSHQKVLTRARSLVQWWSARLVCGHRGGGWVSCSITLHLIPLKRLSPKLSSAAGKQAPTALCPCPSYRQTCLAFYMDSGGLNWGPHACAVSSAHTCCTIFPASGWGGRGGRVCKKKNNLRILRFLKLLNKILYFCFLVVLGLIHPIPLTLSRSQRL